jgi:hypothetical protein
MSRRTDNALQPIVLAILLVASAECALAGPIVQNINGVLQSGETLQLSGQAFGPSSTLISWDDFEGGTPNQNLSVPEIGPTWTFQSNYPATPYPYYSVDRAYSGSLSAKVVWKEPGYSGYSINAFGWTGQGPLNSLYVSYWRYHDPSDDDITTKNHKQLYMFGNADSGDHQDVQQFMPFMVPAGQTGWAAMLQDLPANAWYYGGFPYSATLRTWNRWEAFIKYDSTVSANDGYLEVWVDAVLRRQEANQNLCDVVGGNAVNDIRIGHMFQGFQNMEYVRSFFDDIYISTSRARVELGNAPSFNACTRREIQIPVAWADHSITIKSHYSSAFSPGSTAYLFVVDQAGTPSPGIPLVVGGSTSGDTVSPTVNFSSPVYTGNTYAAPLTTVSIAGSAADNVGVVSVTWENGLGGSGAGQGTQNWSVPNIPLFLGINRITVRAYDAQGNAGDAYIDVEYNVPGQPSRPQR